MSITCEQYDEVVNTIAKICAKAKVCVTCVNDIDAVISAAEKQIPKMPLRRGVIKGFAFHHYSYVCPDCHCEISDNIKIPNFCHNCGRAMMPYSY